MTIAHGHVRSTFNRYAESAGTWKVLAVGDLSPRVAHSEEQAYRWARNLGGAVVTHPNGREETIPWVPKSGHP